MVLCYLLFSDITPYLFNGGKKVLYKFNIFFIHIVCAHTQIYIHSFFLSLNPKQRNITCVTECILNAMDFNWGMLEGFLSAGCMTAIALGCENMENQNKLAEAEAFQQLVRLIRSPKTSRSVLLMVIKVLGILCVGKHFFDVLFNNDLC